MINFVFKYLLKYKFRLFIVILLNLLLFFLEIYIPYVSAQFLDSLILSIKISMLNKFALKILLLLVTSTLCKAILQLLIAQLNINCSFNINFDIVEHLKKIDIIFLKSYQSSYLTDRVNTDSNQILLFVLNNMTKFFTTIATGIVCIYIIHKVSLVLSIILILLIPIYIFQYMFLKNTIYKFNMVYKEALSNYFGSITNQLDNVKLIKSNVTFKEFNNLLINNFYNVKKSFYKSNTLNVVYSSTDRLVKNIALCTVYFFAGRSVINGDISVGNFSVSVVYFNMILQSLSYFFNIGKSYQSAKVSYVRVREYLDMTNENKGNMEVDEINSIKLKNICFNFEGQNVLYSNLTYTFLKNNIYLIKGENGKGKTTLINIIIGLIYKEYRGTVFVSNIDILDLDLYAFRKRHLSIMHQNEILSNISIYNNVTEFGRHTNISEIKYLANLLYLDVNFINYAEDRVSFLSDGEKQKIGIIKTLIKNKSIVIMDEPTSALDYNSKLNFIMYLQRIKENKIIILISHDKDIMTIADKILNL